MSERPVACSLPDRALAERGAALRAGVLARARRVELLEDGMRWTFEGTTDLLAELGPVIDAERACCRFLRFRITVADDLGDVVVEATGPPGTRAFLETWLPRPSA